MLRLLQRYTKFPQVLFRINNGSTFKMRDMMAQQKLGRVSYNVLVEDGKVKPIAMTSNYFIRPNGASMRANTLQCQMIFDSFKGQDVKVFGVPKDTELPNDLILIHGDKDHYSLQPRVEMSYEDFNIKLTEFFANNARCWTKEAWQKIYPEATS